MPSRLLLGLVAGTAGTVALNVTTYLDMAARGRGPSSVPAAVAHRLAKRIGLDPTPGATADEAAQQMAQHRLSGIGALLGYATGLGIGVAYGVLQPNQRSLPVPLAGVAIGLAAIAASDLPAIASGATNPADWGTSGWLADIIPHLVYGLTAAAAFDALRD